MHLAWLYLFHARFQRDKIDYRYRLPNGHSDRIDGEPKTRELQKCANVRWPIEDPRLLHPLRRAGQWLGRNHLRLLHRRTEQGRTAPGRAPRREQHLHHRQDPVHQLHLRQQFPRGHRHRRQRPDHDDQLRPSTCNTAAGTCLTYSYDGEGNLIQRVDATGTTAFTYDRLNHLVTETLPVTTVLTTTTDGAGNLTGYTQHLPAQAADRCSFMKRDISSIV